jgi:effector-binding domain-containing protein
MTGTTTEPSIVERAAQPYVAVQRVVTLEEMATVPDQIPGLFEWLGARGGVPARPPFLRYLVIDMERALGVEAGVPTTAGVPGDEPVVSGTLPAGRYVTVTHTGHPQELLDVTANLLAWAEERQLAWDATDTPEGMKWGCRLEVFLSDPREIPDWSAFETQLLFRLRD